jgi:hypothetical protein
MVVQISQTPQVIFHYTAQNFLNESWMVHFGFTTQPRFTTQIIQYFFSQTTICPNIDSTAYGDGSSMEHTGKDGWDNTIGIDNI